jgi:hypothetical protein
MKTPTRWTGSLIALALFAAFASVGAKPVRERPATKAGWWIRVNPEKTHAATISFQVGMKEKGSQVWRTWTVGQQPEFDLPVELRGAAELYIRATTTPKNKEASFCVFFQNHGVEHFKFDGDKDHQMKPHDSDNDCHP